MVSNPIRKIFPPHRWVLIHAKFFLNLSCALGLLLLTWSAIPQTVFSNIAAATPDFEPHVTLVQDSSAGSITTALQPPMQFEPNLGQTGSQVQFMARGVGYTVFLTPSEAVLVLPAGQPTKDSQSTNKNTPDQTNLKQVVHLQVLGANPSPVIRGVNKTSTTINRLSGSDPTQWQTHVPVYAQVRYDAMYPGIDLLYYGNQQQLEYDFIVHPGADPSIITLGIQGADHATLEEDGHLQLSLPGGTLRLQKPVLSQTTNAGETIDIPGSFLLLKSDPTDTATPLIQVTFAVGAYDPTLPLIIDPLVNYASAFGGEGPDLGEAIALDNAGHGYLVGTTDSITFPVSPNAFQDSAIGQDRDVFVTKFNTETSEILFSTYIGGEGDDRATGVAVDDQGMPYVTGKTTSLTFPTQHPLQETRQGSSDAFVLKLAADGSSLLYSSYLGGSGPDHANAIVVDQEGQASLTGATTSPNFPTINAIDDSLGNGKSTPQSDVFVTTLDAQGATLTFSTFLGGTGTDIGHSLTLDDEGGLYLTGETAEGTGFLVTGSAFQATYGGGETDAFIAKINPRLVGPAALQYGTYLGGSGEEVGIDILVDTQQHAFITGWTTGRGQVPNVAVPSRVLAPTAPVSTWGRRTNPPTSVKPARSFRGVMRGLRQQGSTPTPPPTPLRQLTSLKPLPEFPVTPDAYDSTFNGEKDAFLAQINVAASGSAGLVYATYVGGSNADIPKAIGLDSLGRLCLAGTTNSPDYPMQNALANQGILSGGIDGFITKFNPDPATVLFSSFLGGSADETVTGMRLDAKGLAYLTGQTSSTDFPLLTTLDSSPLTGEPQAFIVKIQDPADLQVTLTGPRPNPGRVSEIQTFDIVYRNLGPDVATDARLILNFDADPGNSGAPPRIEFNTIDFGPGLTSSQPVFCSGTANSGPGGINTCTFGDLTASRTDVGTATLTVEGITAGTYNISAQFLSSTPEIDSSSAISILRNIGISGRSLASLTVDFVGSGTGMVVARPGTGSDPTSSLSNDGTLEYASGTMVSLVPTATGSGTDTSVFREWTGCDSVNQAGTCTVTVNSSRTISPLFELVQPTVTVPNIVGQTLAVASTAITDVTGLSLGTLTQANSATVPSGNVISQSPGPGPTPSGSTVDLVASLGPVVVPPVTVPNVVGQSQAAATAAIAGVTGLSVGTVTQANNATVPPGNIISQNPGTGSAPSGSTVDFVVSLGPVVIPPVTVPNIVGQTQGAAIAAITNVTGLSVGTVTQDNSDTVPSGNVISQNPGPGQFPSGSTIDFVVSLGPVVIPPVTVPDVVGQTQTAATAAINGVTGLNVSGVTRATNAAVPPGTVISQNPGPGPAPSGSTVTLVVSSGTDLIVTTLDDGPDAAPGDGACDTGTSACTLRAAIQEANAISGDQTITLPPGTYTLTVAGANEDRAATGDLDITDDVLIESTTGNAEDVIITANAMDRVFDLPPGNRPSVTLRGLTIQEGDIVGSTGGGLRNAQGTIIIEDSVVTENQSNGSGGGISHLGGTLTVRNTMITNNTSQGLGGGLQAQDGTVTIDGNTRFTGNTANFGGGLSTGGTDVTLINTRIEDNTAMGGGGGIYKFLSPGDLLGSIQASRVALSNTTVRNNSINDCEGTLINAGNNTFGTMTRCKLLAP